MATKDFNSSKNNHEVSQSYFSNDPQFKNLNLNQNSCASINSAVTSKSDCISGKNYDKDRPKHGLMNSKPSQYSNWKGSSKTLDSKVLNKFNNEYGKQSKAGDGNAQNSSTLSAHIASYENSVKVEEQPVKQNLPEPTPAPKLKFFNFPRQPKEYSAPETMEFKRSRKLLYIARKTATPNSPQTEFQKQKAIANEFFKNEKYFEAEKAYTEMLANIKMSAEETSIIYSNRSATFFKLLSSKHALRNAKADAEMSIRCNPEWWRGHFRLSCYYIELENWHEAHRHLLKAYSFNSRSNAVIEALKKVKIGIAESNLNYQERRMLSDIQKLSINRHISSPPYYSDDSFTEEPEVKRSGHDDNDDLLFGTHEPPSYDQNISLMSDGHHFGDSFENESEFGPAFEINRDEPVAYSEFSDNEENDEPLGEDETFEKRGQAESPNVWEDYLQDGAEEGDFDETQILDESYFHVEEEDADILEVSDEMSPSSTRTSNLFRTIEKYDLTNCCKHVCSIDVDPTTVVSQIPFGPPSTPEANGSVRVQPGTFECIVDGSIVANVNDLSYDGLDPWNNLDKNQTSHTYSIGLFKDENDVYKAVTKKTGGAAKIIKQKNSKHPQYPIVRNIFSLINSNSKNIPPIGSNVVIVYVVCREFVYEPNKESRLLPSISAQVGHELLTKTPKAAVSAVNRNAGFLGDSRLVTRKQAEAKARNSPGRNPITKKGRPRFERSEEIEKLIKENYFVRARYVTAEDERYFLCNDASLELLVHSMLPKALVLNMVRQAGFIATLPKDQR